MLLYFAFSLIKIFHRILKQLTLMQESLGVDALSVGFHPTIIKRYSKEIKVDLFNPSANKYGTFSTKLSITVCVFFYEF